MLDKLQEIKKVIAKSIANKTGNKKDEKRILKLLDTELGEYTICFLLSKYVENADIDNKDKILADLNSVNSNFVGQLMSNFIMSPAREPIWDLIQKVSKDD